MVYFGTFSALCVLFSVPYPINVALLFVLAQKLISLLLFPIILDHDFLVKIQAP